MAKNDKPLEETDALRPQTGAGSDQSEDLSHLEHNPDVIHSQDQYRHLDARLAEFLDRPLHLDKALELGAEALCEDLQKVAESMDRLVSKGVLVCAGHLIHPASNTNQVGDIYNEDRDDLREGNSPQQPLDSVASEGRGDMVRELAEQYAHDKGATLGELPDEEQLALIERAEKEVSDDNLLFRAGTMDEPPPADENAPGGYEKHTDEAGVVSWKPMGDSASSVAIERPGETDMGGY